MSSKKSKICQSEQTGDHNDSTDVADTVESSDASNGVALDSNDSSLVKVPKRGRCEMPGNHNARRANGPKQQQQSNGEAAELKKLNALLV